MFSFSYFYLYDNISLLLYIVAINVNGFYCRFVVCFDIVVEIHIQFGRRRRFRFGSVHAKRLYVNRRRRLVCLEWRGPASSCEGTGTTTTPTTGRRRGTGTTTSRPMAMSPSRRSKTTPPIGRTVLRIFYLLGTCEPIHPVLPCVPSSIGGAGRRPLLGESVKHCRLPITQQPLGA